MITRREVSHWEITRLDRLTDFYPQVSAALSRYALYSRSLERFIAVSPFDMWPLQDCAELLSNKMQLSLCIPKFKDPFPFTNTTCLNWRIKDKDPSLPQSKNPALIELNSLNEFEEVGIPAQPATAQIYLQQDFVLFMIKAAFALRLTELRLNVHSKDMRDLLKNIKTPEEALEEIKKLKSSQKTVTAEYLEMFSQFIGVGFF